MGQKALLQYLQGITAYLISVQFTIIICQNHINLMYDKWIKWIHLGLQESSFINADIYSFDFNVTMPPLVKHRALVSDFSAVVGEIICFLV